MKNDVFDFELEEKKTGNKKVALIVISVIMILIMIAVGVGFFYFGLLIGKDLELKEQANPEILENMPLIDEVYQIIKDNYYEDIEWADVEAYVAAGMAGSLDNFSGLGFNITSNNDVFGISLKSNIYNEHVVTNVLDNSSAKRAKGIGVSENNSSTEYYLSRGDKIIKINNNDVSGITLDTINKTPHLMGGESVKLVVERGENELYELNIRRNPTDNNYASYTNLGSGVGMIQLSQFGYGSGDDFIRCAEEFTQDTNASKLIVDLRDNGGGSTVELAKIASCLIENKGNSIVPIIQFVDKNNKLEYLTLPANSSGNYVGTNKVKYKLSILINGGSASASEALTGCVRYYQEDTIVVGSPTYGKGIGQSSYLVGDGKYVLSITTGKFNVPVNNNKGQLSWKNYHGVSMNPDIGEQFIDFDIYSRDFSRFYNMDFTKEIYVQRAIQRLSN